MKLTAQAKQFLKLLPWLNPIGFLIALCKISKIADNYMRKAFLEYIQNKNQNQ